MVGMWIHHPASCLGRRHLVAKSSSRIKCPTACFPHLWLGQQTEANSGQEDPGCLAHRCGENPEAGLLAAPTELSNFQGVNGEKVAYRCVSNKRLNSASVLQGQDLGLVQTLLSHLVLHSHFKLTCSPAVLVLTSLRVNSGTLF